ncbi:MAG: class I SAM-dependent methyltransferase [Saprospiraceae bacterium]|nr:class I SAM-dependent methyltransferase [Saprospiraceae bacterium]
MDKNKFAVELFDHFAQQYQDQYMDVSLYHDSFDLFCDFLPPGSEVLEIACGPGNITRYLLHNRPDLCLLATDLSPNMLDLARRHGPTADFQLLDCRHISKIGRTFHGLMGGFCLPYLSKEEAGKLIEDAATLLRPDGVLYLSTMEGSYERSGWQGPSSGGPRKLFLYYHEADQLVTSLQNHGFTLVDLRRKEYRNTKGEAVVDLILIARRS